MWDFYYSAEQEEIMVADAPKQFPPKEYLYKLFDGKAFTEMVEVGEKPVSNFKDMKFVGTGDETQTRYHTWDIRRKIDELTGQLPCGLKHDIERTLQGLNRLSELIDTNQS